MNHVGQFRFGYAQILAPSDRQSTEGHDLPPSLDTVANEFGGFLEQRVREIIEGAEARAAEIERDADQKARERTRELLDNIQVAQSALSNMVEELRAELEDPEPREPSPVEPPPAPRAVTAAVKAEQSDSRP